jgi:alkylhydroperoxidase/carboxymuconolactone decarboxylase family protein YurZ
MAAPTKESTMASSERSEQILMQMADSNPELIEGLIGAQIQNIENSGLDPKVHALVRIGALVAVGAPSASFAWQVSLARECGATADEITGALVTVVPVAGMPRAVAAAPHIAEALGSY